MSNRIDRSDHPRIAARVRWIFHRRRGWRQVEVGEVDEGDVPWRNRRQIAGPWARSSRSGADWRLRGVGRRRWLLTDLLRNRRQRQHDSRRCKERDLSLHYHLRSPLEHVDLDGLGRLLLRNGGQVVEPAEDGEQDD